MPRRSITERYDKLADRRADMEKFALAKATPTPVHVATVDVLSNLLKMGNLYSTDKVPAPLRAMMRTLEMMKPTLIEELASVPPEAIAQFMGQLEQQIHTIAAAGQVAADRGPGEPAGAEGSGPSPAELPADRAP